MRTAELNSALQVLQHGGIVAMPTDTVYGLHCDPHQLSAIKKILALKQRSPDKGLILIADCFERFAEYIQPLPEEIEQKLRAHPGITWLVPALENVSELITGKFNTVAIRICQQPMIAKLSALLNSPLISTSANISNLPVAQNVQDINTMFATGIDLVIAGELSADAKASEIRDALTDQRLR